MEMMTMVMRNPALFIVVATVGLTQGSHMWTHILLFLVIKKSERKLLLIAKNVPDSGILNYFISTLFSNIALASWLYWTSTVSRRCFSKNYTTLDICTRDHKLNNLTQENTCVLLCGGGKRKYTNVWMSFRSRHSNTQIGNIAKCFRKCCNSKQCNYNLCALERQKSESDDLNRSHYFGELVQCDIYPRGRRW